MTGNPADVVSIEGSPDRLLGLAGGSVLMTALSAAIGFELIPFLAGAPPFTRAICIFGTALFALSSVIWLRRVMFDRGPVVTISSQGICDRRVAADVIPWSAIRKISTWETNRQRFLILNVDPAVERTLRMSTIAKYTRSANRALGADGLFVSAHGLKISFDELWKLVEQRVPETARS